ncbi:hypothetical protein CRYUN_Cryun05aG0187400 [Craigia yunnanensis]
MDGRQKRISVLMFPWLAHELHLPSLPELPPHYHTTNALPPHLMNTLKKAFDMSSLAFAKILKTLNPDLLIYDFIQPWAPILALSHNIPAIHFLCSSTVMTSSLFHAIKKLCQEFPFPEIYIDDFTKTKFSNLLENSSGDFSDKDRLLQCFERSSNIILIKTFRELEGKYLNYLSVLLNKKTVPAGPLVQDPMKKIVRKKTSWNGVVRRKKSSTVFVSFGSEYFLSKKEMEEIACEVELERVNFIWVVRFPVGEKIKLEEALPEGFLERIGERGMPLNARLVVDVGVGLEVRRNKDGNREREEMAKVIKELVAEKDGEKREK